MIESEIREISKYIFNQILKMYDENDFDLFLFGSAKNHIENGKELDFILIVPDNTKLFQICNEISFILLQAIEKFNKIITCFPIHRTDFINKNSQFICNIESEGLNAKKFI